MLTQSGSTAHRRTPRPRLVSDLMSSHVICIGEEATLESVAEVFDEDTAAMAAPIVDLGGHVVGVVARIDVPEELEPRRLLQAKDVMEPVETHVRKSWPVERAAEVVARSALADVVPVFEDDTEVVVGMIGRRDISPPDTDHFVFDL